MLWVVIGHTPLMTEADPNYAMTLYHVAYSFHMPLFIAISGYLFYMTRLSGGGKYWTWKAILKDKFIRLGIPFVVFTIIAMVVKTMFPGDMARQSSITITEFLKAVLYPGDGPLGELWFIAVIMWAFVLTPVWRRIFSSGLFVEISVLLLLVFIHMRSAFGFYDNIHFLSFSIVLDMLIWFYLGMLVYKYEVIEKIDNSMITLMIISGFLYPSSIWINIPMLPTIFAIIFSIGVAKMFERFVPSVFSSFRNYTYQIYLIGIFAQIAVKMIYKRIDIPYFLFYLICLIMGLYVPVAVSKIAEYINWKPILLCIGLKKK